MDTKEALEQLSGFRPDALPEFSKRFDTALEHVASMCAEVIVLRKEVERLTKERAQKTSGGYRYQDQHARNRAPGY